MRRVDEVHALQHHVQCPCSSAYTSVSANRRTYRRTSLRPIVVAHASRASGTRLTGSERVAGGGGEGRPPPHHRHHTHTHTHGQRTKTEWYNMGTVLLHTVLHIHYNIPFHRRKILIEINETIAMDSKKCSDFYLFNFVSTRFKNHLPYNLKFIKIMERERTVRSASNKQHFSQTDNVYTIRHLSWIN